jgi:hypothetical protein
MLPALLLLLLLLLAQQCSSTASSCLCCCCFREVHGSSGSSRGRIVGCCKTQTAARSQPYRWAEQMVAFAHILYRVLLLLLLLQS